MEVLSPELEVLFWQHGAYLDPDADGGPPFFIPQKWIMSQVCRLTINLPKRRNGNEEDNEDEPRELLWATTGLARVRCTRALYTDNSQYIKQDVIVI